MIVSIMQPAYMPWLGYFDRIARSDVHVVLNDVAMDMNSRTKFGNRNKIRTQQGWAWLTVPLKSFSQSSKVLINEIEIAPNDKWREKHLRTLQFNYSKSIYYSDYYNYFESFYKEKWAFLEPMLFDSTRFLLNKLNVNTPLVSSSELSLLSKKSNLILDICRKFDATVYLSGPFGRHYLDKKAFERAGIELQFHDYFHPTYEQSYDGFEPYMSILDLLFNHGDNSLEILQS